MTAPTVPSRLEFIPTQAAPDVNDIEADGIHVRWVMPEIFHDIPIHVEDEDEAVRLIEELAQKALPGTEVEEWLKFAVICALGMDDLLAAGAEFAAVCVGAVDETPCTATVYAALTDSPEGDDQDPIAAIASSLRREDMGEVTEIQLPCGPAVSCTGTREDKVTGELTEDPQGLALPTSFIRVYVPLPNGTTLVMEMSTPTPAGWDPFATMFGNIVSSIRLFEADGEPLIIPDLDAVA
ncbi:hypothetical protein GCM10010277_14590 [Streptomyces longisporoflavus]|uniref:hypothetical protein n=1 Tax=Streptomyces longisporoflavus TaxID=28044 RepID=UPI00167CB873|nr:hypothetical protein [Streptomyces longisporoflavus]GGV31130.1 hypothetical protein GCM10010277_14590 [Streptomyces longisporoflavus]